MRTDAVAMGLGWDVDDYTQIQICQAFFHPQGYTGAFPLLPRTLAPIYAATVTAGAAESAAAGTMGQAPAAPVTPSVTGVVSSLVSNLTSKITGLFGSSRPTGAEKRAEARKGSGPVIAQVQRALDGLRNMVERRGRTVPAVAPPAFTAEASKLVDEVLKKNKVAKQPWRWDIAANTIIEWADKAAQELSKAPVAAAAVPTAAAPAVLAAKPAVPVWLWPVAAAGVLGIGFLAFKAMKGGKRR